MKKHRDSVGRKRTTEAEQEREGQRNRGTEAGRKRSLEKNRQKREKEVGVNSEVRD